MSEEKSAPYLKNVIYSFYLGRNDWTITGFGEDWCSFEDARKNSQEDCHVYCHAEKVDGKWHLDEESRDRVESYKTYENIAEIEAYFNEHGMPKGTEQPVDHQDELYLLLGGLGSLMALIQNTKDIDQIRTTLRGLMLDAIPRGASDAMYKAITATAGG